MPISKAVNGPVSVPEGRTARPSHRGERRRHQAYGGTSKIKIIQPERAMVPAPRPALCSLRYTISTSVPVVRLKLQARNVHNITNRINIIRP
jgi:hypothetical protein